MRHPIKLLLILACASSNSFGNPEFNQNIIGGTEAGQGEFSEVANFNGGRGLCSGVLVGPRVLITAAHCAKHGQVEAEVIFADQSMSGTVELHPFFQKSESPDHDMALVLLSESIGGVRPASIDLAGEAQVHAPVTMVGFGCSEAGGNGIAGVKRFGRSSIAEVRNGQFVVRNPLGSAVCFGDSGGPLYANSADDPQNLTLIGVHVAGNLRDTSYSLRLDEAENLKFMLIFAHKHRVDICGLTVECASIQPLE